MRIEMYADHTLLMHANVFDKRPTRPAPTDYICSLAFVSAKSFRFPQGMEEERRSGRMARRKFGCKRWRKVVKRQNKIGLRQES